MAEVHVSDETHRFERVEVAVDRREITAPAEGSGELVRGDRPLGGQQGVDDQSTRFGDPQPTGVQHVHRGAEIGDGDGRHERGDGHRRDANPAARSWQ
ncbi:MAG: hypothetical protein JHC84_14185 [Solirubrobacteraceae bacterium]|nr:hypothetical protein [Solirubrobacteraceae bacterium]